MPPYTEPHWNQCALVTIDTQNDNSLSGSKAEVAGTPEILPAMRRLAEAYRQAQLPIVHVIRLYKEDGTNVDICRRDGFEKGSTLVLPNTAGAELVNEIKPLQSPLLDSELLLEGHFQQLGPYDWAMYKPRWGAFYQTRLEEFLTQQKVDTLVFAGCNFPNCPRTSMYEASERDLRVVMAVDAISGVYDKGVEELKNIGVAVLSSGDIIRQITHL
ncbi:cysteine hydrolase family protein [Paenibacillus sp. FSL R7-0179]|uniref:cysteine hydrolase family protein n=1 Tax=Paenibacillus sp. FSL R7-0179 TaxID=2921672 RepID=UPI0030FC3463